MRELKPSGIEWVGTIPVEWSVGRIGGLYYLRNQKVSDVDYPPLSVTNRGILPQLETAAKSNAHDDRKLVKVGDFAINSRSDRRGVQGKQGMIICFDSRTYEKKRYSKNDNAARSTAGSL